MALTNKLTAIGNAIREKTGKTDLISLGDMPDEIRSITTTSETESKLPSLFNKTITSITAQDLQGATYISNAASGTTTLEYIVIPEGVTEIEYNAFSNCTGLKAIEIGKDVYTIGTGILSNCPKLKTVLFKGNPSLLSSRPLNNGSFADGIDIYVPWSEDSASNSAAPWGFTRSGYTVNIHYDSDVDNLYVDASGIQERG